MEYWQLIITGGITAITTAVTVWKTIQANQEDLKRQLQNIQEDLRDHIVKHTEDFANLEMKAKQQEFINQTIFEKLNKQN